MANIINYATAVSYSPREPSGLKQNLRAGSGVRLQQSADRFLPSPGKCPGQASKAAKVFKLPGTNIAPREQSRASLGNGQDKNESMLTYALIRDDNQLSASASIMDLDVSLEMTEFIRNRMLAQSRVDILTQGIALPRMAMSLVFG